MKKRLLLGGACLLTAGLILLLDAAFPPDMGRLAHVSCELRSSKGDLLHVAQTPDEKWRMGVRLTDLDPLYISMLITREDQYFYRHFGVNPFSLARASWQWMRTGKRVSGGSTLTMQVARLLEPKPRTFSSKVKEIIRAFQLEKRFTKDQIMEMYLTLAPFGGNLEGVRAASYAYFGLPPRALSPAQCALLVSLPQLPSRWNGRQFSPSAVHARNSVLTLAHAQKRISNQLLALSLKEPLPSRRLPLPREAPHVARLLHTQAPGQRVLVTTLDPWLQKRVEGVAHHMLKPFTCEVNMAILVACHQTGRILAYVGSSDFSDTARAGQVDFVQAYRSPGSALKPFIYGLAFEMGLVQASTLVRDDRRRFGAYMPDNFDRNFQGVITIAQALYLSRNIPAVALLNHIGPQRFVGMLEEVGISLHFPDPLTPPGLSLALGGVGMTLQQLVTLYAGLGQKGAVRPLQLEYTSNPTPTIPMLSQRAASTLTHILTQTLRNDFGAPMRNLAVKTGTSYGHRDAIAVGYDDRYVVGVWIGRPDGAPFGLGTGGSLAVPVLTQVFRLLPVSKRGARPSEPQFLGLRNAQNQSRTQQDILEKVRPQLLFPVSDTAIEVFDEGAPRSLHLHVQGGKRPYTWLVDNHPLATTVWKQKTPWTPQKPGFYTITLLDSQGQSESVRVEVK